MKFSAEVKDLTEFNVLAVRHTGPYNQIGNAIEKLFSLAGPTGLVNFPQTQLLGVFYDDPDEVETENLRSDACITVDAGIQPPEGTHMFKIPGGKFAVAHVEIDLSQYRDAWMELQGEWIPANGHTKDMDPERICYELYLNDPEEHPQKKHIVDICVPVQ